MSWDVLLLRLPDGVTSIQAVADDYVPPALGRREEVLAAIRLAAPEADLSDPSCGELRGPGWSMDLNIGSKDPVDSVMLHIRASGDDVRTVVFHLAVALGCGVFDCSDGELMAPRDANGRHAFQEFRDRVIDRAAWSVSEMAVHYSVAAPREADARSMASALARRGHRWVTVRPVYLPHLDPGNGLFGKPEFSWPELEGWWSVDTLVDEEAPDSEAEFHQQECERAAVDAIARAHGGFWNGGSMAHRETMLPGFDQRGLAHELDQRHAHRVRRDVISTFPGPTEEPGPTPPLSCTTFERPFPSVLECVRQVAREQKTRPGGLPAGTARWLTAEADEFADDREVIFELADSVMHQGTCYPHTADEIPLLAWLAVHEDIRPAHRAVFTKFLFEAATIGERLAASGADRRVALGLSLEETADELAARHAVEAVAPYLLDRWHSQSEAVQFGLAALAAATRHGGVGPRIRRLAERWTEGPRTDALRLAAALAEADPVELSTVLRSIVESGSVPPGRVPSPLAPARGAAFNLLRSMVERELSALQAAP
jgi:hypothetical protein